MPPLARTAVAIVLLLAPPPARPADAPIPPAAWVVPGPVELRVGFATPMTAAQAQALVGRAIRFGDAAAPATVAIAGATLADGGRTLILATDPHPFQASYRLDLADGDAGAPPLAYTLAGAEASWAEGDGQGDPAWTASLPEFGTARLARVAASRVADLARPGRLTLRSRIALPAGAKATFRLVADAPFEATLGDANAAAGPGANGRFMADLPFASTGDPAELWAIVETGAGGKAPTLTLAAEGADADAATRALLLPWASPAPAVAADAAPPAAPFDLAGGDPARGAEVFRSQEARCSQCHRAAGQPQGGEVGPDLTDQAGRDLALIYRDLAEPSVVIRPDYITYTVARTDGQVAVGVLRAQGADALRILDTDAKATLIPRGEVADIQPSGASVMPVGLAGALGEARVRDLLAFLRAQPPAIPARPSRNDR
jgi:putative heme-binding domain-containing protein